MLFINFKTYQSGTGEEGLRMAKVVENVSRETGIEMAVVVQVADVLRVAKEVLVPVWAQHVDGIEYGAHTGWVLPEAVKANGAIGVMLNHSERKLVIEDIERAMSRAREVSFKTLVCAATPGEVERVMELDPDFVAYEPPEFIGSRDKSVSSEKSETVREVIKLAGQERILIGAGIHSADDIRVGLELGAFGFLVATDIMKAENPEEELKELAGGYNTFN
jgi:triosephosphate isomerase